jgi:hypothetical protein
VTEGRTGGAATVDLVSRARRSITDIGLSAESNGTMAFALGFLTILVIGANSAGYWPPAWGWSSLALLVVSGFAAVLRSDVRVSWPGAVLAIGLFGFTLWSLASSLWAPSATQPVQQSERLLVYLAAVVAVLLVVRMRSYRHLLGGTWTAVVVLSGYGLLTRLFPDRFGTTDLIAGYRLEAPLGYWNALGIFTVMGLLLSLGFAARGRRPLVRGLAGVTTVVLLPTMYFTFSRGAWISLVVAVVVLIALDRRRLQMITTMLIVAPWPLLAVWSASRTPALTTTTSSAASATAAGHRYALIVVILAAVAGLAAYALALGSPRIRIPRATERAYAAVLGLVAVGILLAVFARFGSPAQITRHVYNGFVGQSSPPAATNLNQRLFNLSAGLRIPQWKVAWHDYVSHSLLGSGAGTYARYWNQFRPVGLKVANAHNLYLETLAELGPIGLVLLVIALGAPLVAAIRARRHALVAPAIAAYAAFLIHAAVDWDWQMPAVTLVALFCATAVIASQGDIAKRYALSPPWRIAALALIVMLLIAGFVGLRGNQAISDSQDAAAAGNWGASAAAARTAATWAPWSSQPPQLLGEALAAEGNLAAARADFTKALSIDDTDWSVWLDLAIASQGATQQRALSHALALNPLSPEIASWRATVTPTSAK